MSDLERPGFAGFAAAIAGMLGGRVVALDERVLRAPEPPRCCPTCGFAALDPSRDPNGEWTWSCVEGCNP